MVIKAKKKKKPPSLQLIVFNSIMETLQANSSGEFDLPSILTKYNDKSDPRSKLGLHREMFVPANAVPFYEPESKQAMMLFRNQASIILPAIVGEGISIKNKKFDLPLCRECKG